MSGRVLIVDDVATNRVVLKAKLSAAYYNVLQAESGEDALRMAKSDQPDVILLDVMMPGLDGFETCRRLKSDPATRHIPVVIVTARNDSAARMRGLEAGADDFLSKPINDQALLARVRMLLREKTMVDELRLRGQTCRALGLEEEAASPPAAPVRAHVQIVDSETARGMILGRALGNLLPDRIEVTDARRALSADDDDPRPDCMLIRMDDRHRGEALDLLAEIRSRPATRYSAVVMVLPDNDVAGGASVLDLGANDYVFASSDMHELAVRIRSQTRRKRYSDRLRESLRDGLRLAVTDPLTGLYNRRYALNHLAQIAARARESGQGYAVLLLDIDRFKSINDRFGHAAGDHVLVTVAARLRDNLRGVDLLARYGGEEFLAALPDTGLAEARIAAERLRRIVAETEFELPGRATSLRVTLSVGVALCDGADCPLEGLIEQADRALYASKSEGRNQVSFSRPAA